MTQIQDDEVGIDSLGRSYRSSISSQLQAVQADYYTIVDAEEWPIAGLIVLVDGRKQPVRGELHLYEELADHRNEFALRQAQIVINERYYSAEPIQLQVLQSYAWRETLQVRTSGEPIQNTVVDPMEFVQQYWQYILAGSAALVLIALIWAITAFFRSPGEETPTTADTTTTETQAAVATTAPAAAPTQIVAQTNDLPASRNADPSLAVGQRAQVLSNVGGVSVVSEPSPDQSKVIGHLSPGDQVQIVNGPVLKQGDSDTIVWWFVRLDSGQEGWIPANISNMALLGLAQ